MAVREGSYCNNSKKPVKRGRTARHYSHCNKKGHNSCTCIVEIKDADNSDTSEE